MISPSKAARLIERRCAPLPGTLLALDRAPGHVLARDIHLPHPLPLFDNSAMDGFALRAADTRRATFGQPVKLRLRRTIYAGDMPKDSLHPGEACGIMTGAPLPPGADTVLPVERSHVEASFLLITSPLPRLQHVRRRGEEVAKGTLLVRRGATVHPGVIACIATAGIGRVRVVRQPVVSVIATGSETVRPGTKLVPGRIYDSNSHTIAAALRGMGVARVYRCRVSDRPKALDRALQAALGRSDVTVVIGGVSVGERDYVRPALQRHRVEQVFWRVAQKPGKPLYFGARGKKLVFGLPGNPASAFTCFYLYVYPALRRLAGHASGALAAGSEPVLGSVTADAEKWFFLKGKAEGGAVAALAGQGSHMITSLARADRLIVVPPQSEPSTQVRTLRLPYAEDEP